MQGKYFRYFFENTDEGLFQTGCVYDKEKQETINYIYMVGSYCRNTRQMGRPYLYDEKSRIPEIIDILVMGCYTVKYINKLIEIVKSHSIKTIILPYLAPIQRLALVEEAKDRGVANKDAIRYLQDPYQFLKKFGIENIYFLYENGEVITREPEELVPGFHFELLDHESMKLIREMEGYSIPAVRAGYIVEIGWLFYFGVYGLDMQILSEFTRDYFSYIENIHEISENIQEDYASQMKRLIQEYLRKFGSCSATTVIMYEGPLYAFPNENETFLTEKEFCREERGEVRTRCRDDSRCLCTISCIYQKDYDNINCRRDKMRDKARLGLLLLGNVNLNRYFSEIEVRFWILKPRIRGVCVPNCGNGEDWNHKILNISKVKDRIYWICGKHEITSVGVVSDIVLSRSNNRFLTIEDGGVCCLSGYIIPKEDID